VPDISDLTLFDVSEPVPHYWRVVYANPPINLLNSTTVVELAALVERIEQHADLNVVVFTSGNPEFFMARYDLSDTSSVAFAPTESGVTLFINSMRQMNEAAPITIASVRGQARGGGSEFALSCDLRFAGHKALFGQPEVGVGMLPAGGAIERLPALVGPARAIEIVASSDDYDAQTAEHYGWVNRVLPDDQLDDFVDSLARRLAWFETLAVHEAKRLIRNQTASPSTERYIETLGAVRGLLGSPTFEARRQAVAQRAQGLGADFELDMGRHLDLSRQKLRY
jgi:enoyl-CoA hydratase/carnithine racemase